MEALPAALSQHPVRAHGDQTTARRSTLFAAITERISREAEKKGLTRGRDQGCKPPKPETLNPNRLRVLGLGFNSVYPPTRKPETLPKPLTLNPSKIQGMKPKPYLLSQTLDIKLHVFTTNCFITLQSGIHILPYSDSGDHHFLVFWEF